MKKLVLIFGLMAILSMAQGQDLHLSQFTMAPLMINPASSGAVMPREATVTHRNQWTSITNPFRTFAITANTRFGDINKQRRGYWGAGFAAFNDQAGDGNLRTNAAGLNLVYHVRLSRYQHIGFGMQSMYMSRFVDYNKFQWASQYDGAAHNAFLPTGETGMVQNFGFVDVNTGVYYTLNNTSAEINVANNNYRIINAGVAVHHITTPRYAFGADSFEENLYAKLVVHANSLWSLPNSSLAIAPNFMFAKQGPHEELSVGSLVRLGISGNSKYTALVKDYAVYGGVNYRFRDAIVTTGIVEYGNYQFGLSYDFNVSRLASASAGRGAVEFQLRYMMNGNRAVVMTSGLK
ncbi:MAG: PorP/SprF family type IX secretion system membrane protein [Flavobacteriales bacterium]